MTLGKEIAFILFFNHSLIYFAGFSLLPGGFLQFRRAGPARQSAQASRHSGFSCCGAQPLGSGTSVGAAHGLSCSMACGIFPDQGLNPCPLNWQANSYPLYHQESPQIVFNIKKQKTQTIKVQTDILQYINTKT